jgi:fatty-acyl-CoA synthase
MRGYWSEPERTLEVIDAAGWMHTGDLGVIDTEGYCSIVGRVKDMIIRGGENVYPREIEEFLYRHPKVLDVAVVGVPDSKYGEEVCAVVRLQEGVTADPEELIEFCREQIAHYKVPRYVRFVTEFPLTVTGKVQKYLIRRQMQDELGLREEPTARVRSTRPCWARGLPQVVLPPSSVVTSQSPTVNLYWLRDCSTRTKSRSGAAEWLLRGESAET